MVNFNGWRRRWRRPSSWRHGSTSSAHRTSYNHYAVGWAHAMDTPYQWTKQVASHWGGTRNGTIVHWPNGINANGEIRTQFNHVIDVAPTILEAAGIPEPAFVNGVAAEAAWRGPAWSTVLRRRRGRPSVTSAVLRDVRQPRHLPQGLDRGAPSTARPGMLARSKLTAFDDDVWELYDSSNDWTQAHDLAKEMPEKLHELQRLWLIEAVKYNVLPIDDRTVERFNPDLGRTPELDHAATRRCSSPAWAALRRTASSTSRTSRFAVTAQIVSPATAAKGVIIAQGGALRRLGLYAKDGTAKFVYNLLGMTRYSSTEATQPIPAGEHQVRMEFAYDGGGLAKGGTRHALLRRREGRRGTSAGTQPMIFSADETTDIGEDYGMPVSSDYAGGPASSTARSTWCRSTSVTTTTTT